MTPAWGLLLFGIVCVALVANALRPVRSPGAFALVAFFAGWLTSDLPLVHVVLWTAAAVGFVAAGALATWHGVVGLALVAAGVGGLWWLWHESGAAAPAVSRALSRAGFPAPSPEPLAWWRALRPFRVRHRAVEVRRDVWLDDGHGPRLDLDVFLPRDRPVGAPILVFVHGGGWVMSQRQRQGLPLLYRMAAAGWVCVSLEYRLSPRAGYPAHLIDVKRGLAWVREHALELGGDPAFVAIHGNSAGAHLAALAALTPNDPRYQAGFEAADTTVQAAVPIYGPYDMLDRHGHWPHREFALFVWWMLMKRKLADDPEAYHAYSPVSLVHAEAPPFFVLHGERDTLVPVHEGRRFSQALAEAGVPVVYAEVPGGQHACDMFVCRRAAAIVDGIEAWLTDIESTHHVRPATPARRC